MFTNFAILRKNVLINFSYYVKYINYTSKITVKPITAFIIRAESKKHFYDLFISSHKINVV